MDTIDHESIIARQRERILARIDKANQLIDDYENILLSSDNPKEKLRVEVSVQETQQLLAKYQAELKSLTQIKIPPLSSANMAIIPVKQDSMPISDEKLPAEHSNKMAVPVEADVQDLDKKLKDLQRGIDDLKRGQGIIYQLLTDTRNQELRMIISLIRQGEFKTEEMTQTLKFIGQALSTLQENQESLSIDVRNAIADANSALQSETSLQGKLELTLPIIPLLLDYKVELAATDSINLVRIWENAQEWWNTLTVKSTERATRELINKYLEEFNSADKYIESFESKINQDKTNIFIKAENEFSKISKLALDMDSDFEVLVFTTTLSRANLRRLEELATNISYQAHAAAATMAVGGTPITQFNQIKQNLPTLRLLLQHIISRLDS